MAHIYGKLIRPSSILTQHLRQRFTLSQTRCLSLAYGKVESLQPKVLKFIEETARTCQPDSIHICDGSDSENQQLINLMQAEGMIKALPKYENCWLARTDPGDVARVESKTVISTLNQRDTIPTPAEGVEGTLGKWMSPDVMEENLQNRFPGCMKGRTMYVIPFSMGPVGSPLSKIGIELTDSPYVVASMRIMTRIGSKVMDVLENGDFVRCIHSVGQPLPMKTPPKMNWPCNPQQTLIAHIPERNEIASFGSGYGGNSLLGKKCFALRLGSILARNEGWLAEHMLILGITNPQGEKKYIAAAFPSACGKTNLAMMNPSLPGWKVECVGDDIAWMRFDESGQLRAINPEAGFFGVAPGTSMATNPNAMKTILSNTVFTNVAETADGGFYWEGMEQGLENFTTGGGITSWKGKAWQKGDKEPAAHPNSRFCTPASQCPIMDADWESPRGVPIDAILLGGRRPQGVPLVYEAFNWRHGVFLGASMRSEATAAAEHGGKMIMHDPFAMRPFFGYNFGDYLKHWLSMEKKEGVSLPKIFHVNWFRKNSNKQFIWPGFGENARVLEWIFHRVNGADCADKTAIGLVPKNDSINLEGLTEKVDMKELFSLPKEFWEQEVRDIKAYFDKQLPQDLPEEIAEELSKLEDRVKHL